MLVKIGFLTFILSAIFCFFLMVISNKNKKLLDNHNGVQNIHKGPVPRVGGVAILASLAIGLIIFFVRFKDINYIYLLISVLPIGIVGFYEDVEHKLSPRFRLIISFLSALIAIILLDAYIVRTGLFFLDYLVRFKIISILFSMVAIAGITNAINIIDGLNGLSSGTAIVLFISIGYLALKFNDLFMLSVVIISGTSILGFFIWNFPYGRIFLGDGGAYIIGFLLSVISILLVKRHNEVSPWFPILILIYPIFETLFSIYRRKIKKGRSMMTADTLHLHSLFYRRVIPLFFNNIVRPESKNPVTSPFIWMLCSFSIFPAIIFFENTALLILASFICSCLYLFFYKLIIRLRLGSLRKIFLKLNI